MRIRALFFAFILVAPAVEASPTSALDLRAVPFVDLYFHVRTLSGGSGEPPAIDGYREAIAAARALGAAGGPLDGLMTQFDSAAEAAAMVERLPERTTLRDGRQVPLREPALELARRLAAVEPAFRSTLWPKRRAAIDAAAARIRDVLLPKEAECFAYLAEHLGLGPISDRSVPVYLVADAPAPHAVTVRRRAGSAVVVSATAFDGSLLFEALLHEALHALDAEESGDASALARLRKELGERDAAHTLMFVHAGETIRRIVDPTHTHYGDAAGYYAKVGEIARVERAAWTAYLDGKISRDEAIDRMLERLRQ